MVHEVDDNTEPLALDYGEGIVHMCSLLFLWITFLDVLDPDLCCLLLFELYGRITLTKSLNVCVSVYIMFATTFGKKSTNSQHFNIKKCTGWDGSHSCNPSNKEYAFYH